MTPKNSEKSAHLTPVKPGQRVAAVMIIAESYPIPSRPKGNMLFLGIAQTKNKYGIGFPGGKVNPGETPLDGAKRELREEVPGLMAPGPAKLIFKTVVDDDDGGILCYAFMPTMIITMNHDESLGASSEGTPIFVCREAFMTGIYAKYNRELFKAIDAEIKLRAQSRHAKSKKV